MIRYLVVCGLLLGAAACGPVQSTVHLLDAEVQIEAARTAGADKLAPYEWTLANLYIHKAREEIGTSDYEVGVDFAHKAATNAIAAKDIAMGKQSPDAAAATPETKTTP